MWRHQATAPTPTANGGDRHDDRSQKTIARRSEPREEGDYRDVQPEGQSEPGV